MHVDVIKVVQDFEWLKLVGSCAALYIIGGKACVDSIHYASCKINVRLAYSVWVDVFFRAL